MRRSIMAALLSLISVVPSVNGIEAITSTAGRESQRARIKDLTNRIEIELTLLATLRKTTEDLGASPDIHQAYAALDVPASSLATSLSVGQIVVLRPNLAKLANLAPALAAKVLELQIALAQYQAQARVVDDLNREVHTLKSLTLAPGFQVNTGSASSSYVPSLQFEGHFDVGGSDVNRKSNFECQFLFSIQPDPPSGSSTDVAQSIRISTGVFNANLGLNYGYFWKPDSTAGVANPDGPQGVEIRVGAPLAYQRASSTTSGSDGTQSGGTATSDFGLFAPEVKLSVWLKYVLIGYKYNRYWAFGAPNAVYNDLNKTGSHKVFIATRIDALSTLGSAKDASSTSPPPSDSPFYVEATYTGKRSAFGGGTFSIAFGKTLTWSM